MLQADHLMKTNTQLLRKNIYYPHIKIYLHAKCDFFVWFV